jgi:hypothetical protein
MGNGALPNGPSYRAHPRLYLSVIRRDAIFWDAIGGIADIGRRWREMVMTLMTQLRQFVGLCVPKT